LELPARVKENLIIPFSYFGRKRVLPTFDPLFISIVSDSYAAHPEIKEFCVDLRSRDVLSPHLLSTLADIFVEENHKEEASKVGA